MSIPKRVRNELNHCHAHIRNLQLDKEKAEAHNSHMLECAKAAGFDSLTEAITAAKKWKDSQTA